MPEITERTVRLKIKLDFSELVKLTGTLRSIADEIDKIIDAHKSGGDR